MAQSPKCNMQILLGGEFPLNWLRGLQVNIVLLCINHQSSFFFLNDQSDIFKLLILGQKLIYHIFTFRNDNFHRSRNQQMFDICAWRRLTRSLDYQNSCWVLFFHLSSHNMSNSLPVTSLCPQPTLSSESNYSTYGPFFWKCESGGH